MKNFILLLILFIAGSVSVKGAIPPQGILGPTSVTVGQVATYSYTNASLYPELYWEVTPGLSNQYFDVWTDGSTNYADIEWIAAGTATITIYNSPEDGFILASLQVTIENCTNPATPVVTFSISSSTCSPRAISYTETPPNGITWYWQTSINGTNMGHSSSSYSVTSSGTYYLRAWNGSCWSLNSAPYSVTVDVPATPTSYTVSTNTCGPKTLTRGTPPAGIGWYWQTSLSGEDYTSSTATSSSYVLSQTGTSLIYLRSRNDTGCWGLTYVKPITVDNPSAPLNTSFNYCEVSTMSMPVTNPGCLSCSANWYDANNNLVASGTTYTPINKSAGTYVYTVKALSASNCESSTGATVTLSVTNGSACDNFLNWSENIGYAVDASGNSIPVSANKVYADGFNTPIQAQVKSFTTNQVFATQSIYDTEGEQTLSTLPAPINSSAFGYRERFVVNPAGVKYSGVDFDLRTTTNAAGEINNPKPVASNGIGSLGWYYSSANTLEPNTPTTDYPYSRSYSPTGPNPTTSKSAGPGNAYKMGSGHEVSGDRLTFTKGELSHYYSLQNYFVSSSLSETNLITNSEATSTTGFSANQSVTITSVVLNNETYVKAVTNQNTSTPGIWPIEVTKPVVAGQTYKFKVKGYRSGTAPVYLFVKNATTNTNLVWPGTVLPQGTANEAWVETSFVAPTGCTSISLGVLFSGPPATGDAFFINSLSFTQVVNDANVLWGNKHLSTDPDGKQTMSFVDATGRSVASALVTSAKGVTPFTYSNWSYTYYNDMGQPIATVAPNGVNTASSAYPAFVTLYKYDHLGRLIETTSPDEGTSQFVYSLDGKIRFSQNQEQRTATPKRFSYTNYDYLGRLIESGEYREDATVTGTPYKFEPHTTTTPATTSVLLIADNIDFTGVTRRYNNVTAQRYNDTTFIEYDWQAVDFVVDASHPSQNNTQGAVTKTKNGNTQSWYSYDEFGQLEWLRQSITGLGVKTTDYTYDNIGNVIQVAYQAGQSDAFYHHYIYDVGQRLTEVWTSKDGTTKTLHARYEYYLHGPLKRVELAGNKQGLDYVYTINGALKSINHADPSKDPGLDGISGENISFSKDIFGQTMHYHDNDYTGAGYNAGTVSLTGTYPNQFGGNLRAVTFNSPVELNKKHIYGYQYDAVNQLTNAQWGDVTGAGTYVPTFTESQRENIPAYDKNGNIQSLIRKGNAAQTTANYNYVYEANTNKLDKVNNNASLMTDYSYNTIGQMIQQTEGSKTMKVAYNAYGLTSEIRDGSNTLVTAYHYDDRGDLVKKIQYTNGVASKNIFYVQDASGTTLAIYEQAIPGAIQLVEIPIYGSGRVATYKKPVDTYFYEVNDHLGNVRGLIGLKATETWTATMENENVFNEEPPYKNITNTRSIFVGANHTPGGNEVVRLNSNKPAGPTISFEVSPGDTVKLGAWAYYEEGNFGTPLDQSVMLSAIASAFGGVSGAAGEAGQIYNTVTGGFPGTLGTSGNSTLPAAFLTYVVYDKNYVKKYWGSAGVSTNGNMNKEFLAMQQAIDEPGYIYICLYNRSNSLNPVYFDDMSVTVTHSAVVAGADYYPFGLVQDMREITDEKYRYGYQGQYSEKDTVNGWNEFELRFYDAKIARWLSADPYGQYYSPYLAMGNIPNMATDPDGGWCCGDFLSISTTAANASMAANAIAWEVELASAVATSTRTVANRVLPALTKLAKATIQFVNGAGNAMASNTSLGAIKLKNSSSHDFTRGQQAGHIISAAWGFAETTLGVLTTGTGGGLTLTGGGAVVGVPLMTLGAGITLHGGAVTANALNNMNRVHNWNMSGSPSGGKSIPNGFKETKEFGYQHGQKVYEYKGKYYSKDIDGHNGGVWKVFEKIKGRLKRIGTADANLNIIKK